MFVAAVTGGNGFIGRRVVDLCLDAGWAVRILTRKEPSVYSSNKTNVSFFQGDLSNPENDFTDFLSNVDFVFHCAAELENESVMESIHCAGTARLLAAVPSDLVRWIQLSSVGVFGPKRAGIINEQTEYSPIGVYEKTKLLADELVEKSAAEKGIQFSLIMPSIVFGNDMPNQSIKSLAQVIERKLFFYIGDNQAVVNYVSADDVARALIMAAVSEKAINKKYILSQHVPLTDMVAALARGVKVEPPRFRIPENVVRLFLRLSRGGIGPLTDTRVDALTSHAVYSSDRINIELGFSYSQSLLSGFQEYASSIRRP